ncbi:MAG: 5-(carboxyamino)imidazole ribonucleotide synthase [Gammaproteobacteria bacterium]|nr:5-(carboxyamino)imidazole ribonucleotide synthase [Gammaproteobacteria bacterium]
MTPRHILPNAMLGILGGGQLGRMFTIAARSMGYRVTVLDPDAESPAGSIADVHLRASYDDLGALDRIAETCSAVTTEFENVPSKSLEYLAARVRVAPAPESVAIAQDRLREKGFIAAAGLPVAPFIPVESDADLAGELDALLPGILKLARFGYDGKGQVRVATRADCLAAFAALGRKPCVLERQVDLWKELSVIVVRSSALAVLSFPAAENHHAAGILDVSIVPARIDAQAAERARGMALQLADAMDYVGVLAVEFFVLQDGEILINEIAPRPHNSGHYTLDACATDQFEQQVRVLCGLPPGDTRLLTPVVMVNLLGDIWRDDEPAWDELLTQSNVKLHLYGKKTARIGRKMGHFNVLSEDVESALSQAERLKVMLGG